MASSRKSTVFRVTGLPIHTPEPEVRSILAETIHGLLTEDERRQVEATVACIPTCDGSPTSSALVDFKGGIPEFLSQLKDNPLGDWQVEMGDDDINFDRHFFGFTQLYPIGLGHPVTAEYDKSFLDIYQRLKLLANTHYSIIAITGLDGHAYGSWRGKGNLGRMWLRDFFSKDLPNCRTMIYGYNSKLLSHGIDTIMDYGREFLEGIKRIRYTQEVGHNEGFSELADMESTSCERDHSFLSHIASEESY
jgi:protein SERAC1